MAYIYSKSSSLQGNWYKLNTVNSCLIICDFTPHLIMGQVFYGTDHVTHSHLSTHLTHEPS